MIFYFNNYSKIDIKKKIEIVICSISLNSYVFRVSSLMISVGQSALVLMGFARTLSTTINVNVNPAGWLRLGKKTKSENLKF